MKTSDNAGYGYDAGVLGGLLTHRPFLNALGNPTGNWTIPMVSSSYTLAACVTSLFATGFAFHIGRRGCIILGCIGAIVGASIQASSFGVPQIIVGRLVTGFGIGCISSSVPAYLAETGITKNDRGPTAAFNGIVLISGVPIAYWIDYGFTKMDNQASWRVPIALQCIFAIASGFCMIFLPDTPRWYYAKNRIEEGDAALCRLFDRPIDDSEVQKIKQEIFALIQIELEANSSLRWQQFLTLGIIDKTPLRVVRRLSMCFWITFIREWMGINVVVYYSTIILGDTGITPELVTLLAGVMNTFFALGTVPLYFTIEQYGRRKIMFWGAVALSISLLIFIIMIALPNQTTATRWTSVAFIFIFIFVFGYAWQGVIWLYAIEISPLNYRHIGASFASFGEWLSSFLTVFAAPIGISNVGWKLYLWILAGDLVGCAFVWFLCPETGNRTLEQVDDIFSVAGKVSEKDPEALHIEKSGI
ncbi:hypothetical protein B7463_g10928, partial [Scytalidium lignicola]